MGTVTKRVLLKCLNPQGVVEIPAPAGLKNPRVQDLAGKKIGIFWDGKKGGENFLRAAGNFRSAQVLPAP
jgi:hypothetical protein